MRNFNAEQRNFKMDAPFAKKSHDAVSIKLGYCMFINIC